MTSRSKTSENTWNEAAARHARFLWFAAGDAKLSVSARLLIENKTNEVWLSPASLWELAIKVSVGKLSLAAPFGTVIPQCVSHNDIQILAITVEHLAVLINLPCHHRDPFDRLLVAQALVEGMDLVSADAALDAYAIKRFW